MVLHEKRCDLCRHYYTNNFGNAGMSNKCLDTSSEGIRPISPSDKGFIDSRGCATFSAGTHVENIFYSLSFNDGILMRDYGKAETAEAAEKLKIRMIAENIKEENIRIVKVISEGVELGQLTLDAADEISENPP